MPNSSDSESSSASIDPIALEAKCLQIEEVLSLSPQSEAGYRQRVDYLIQQLGGDARAYHLFTAHPDLIDFGLPSRTRKAPGEFHSHQLFGVYDLPVLEALRNADSRRPQSIARVGFGLAVDAVQAANRGIAFAREAVRESLGAVRAIISMSGEEFDD